MVIGFGSSLFPRALHPRWQLHPPPLNGLRLLLYHSTSVSFGCSLAVTKVVQTFALRGLRGIAPLTTIRKPSRYFIHGSQVAQSYSPLIVFDEERWLLLESPEGYSDTPSAKADEQFAISPAAAKGDKASSSVGRLSIPCPWSEPLFVDCVDLHYQLRELTHSIWAMPVLGDSLRVDRFTLRCLQAWRWGELNPCPNIFNLFFYTLRLSSHGITHTAFQVGSATRPFLSYLFETWVPT